MKLYIDAKLGPDGSTWRVTQLDVEILDRRPPLRWTFYELNGAETSYASAAEVQPTVIQAPVNVSEEIASANAESAPKPEPKFLYSAASKRQ